MASDRKRWTRDGLLKQVETFGALGLSDEAICNVLDIELRTWQRYVQGKPEFAETIQRGHDKAQARILQELYKNATEKGIPSAQLAFLKATTKAVSPRRSVSLPAAKTGAPKGELVSVCVDNGVPTDAPPAIKASPNASWYCDAVRCDWSVRQLEKHAETHFGEHISRETFRRLSQLIPETERYSRGFRDVVLKGVDAKIDALTELQNVIALQRYRVSRAIEVEQLEGSLVGIEHLPISPCKNEIDALYTMIKDFTNLQINLGLIAKGQAPGPTPVAVETQGRRMRDSARQMSEEDKARLLTVLTEIKAHRPLELAVYDDVGAVSHAVTSHDPELAVSDDLKAGEWFHVRTARA